MRERIPSAVRIVYDNYNALVVGFGPSERASEVAMSIAVYPKWVLPHPKKLLKGSGSRVRSIVQQSADDLDQPAVRAPFISTTR